MKWQGKKNLLTVSEGIQSCAWFCRHLAVQFCAPCIALSLWREWEKDKISPLTQNLHAWVHSSQGPAPNFPECVSCFFGMCGWIKTLCTVTKCLTSTALSYQETHFTLYLWNEGLRQLVCWFFWASLSRHIHRHRFCQETRIRQK